MTKEVAPKCSRMGCPDDATTVREIVEADESRTLDAMCAAHATEYDMILGNLLREAEERDAELERQRIP